MNPIDGPLQPLQEDGPNLPDPANDVDPFDGHGAGDWGDRWIDHRLNRLFEADAQATPSPRLAELLRRLEASLVRDQKG